MAFISVTRLRLRSAWSLPKFFWHAIPSNIQARQAPGNLGIDTLKDAKCAFWTKTAWKDEASMRAYILAGAHGKAMTVLMDMCDEGATTHWVQDSAELPNWTDAHQRLQANFRPSRVRHPSADQQAKRIPPPRL